MHLAKRVAASSFSLLLTVGLAGCLLAPTEGTDPLADPVDAAIGQAESAYTSIPSWNTLSIPNSGESGLRSCLTDLAYGSSPGARVGFATCDMVGGDPASALWTWDAFTTSTGRLRGWWNMCLSSNGTMQACNTSADQTWVRTLYTSANLQGVQWSYCKPRAFVGAPLYFLNSDASGNFVLTRVLNGSSVPQLYEFNSASPMDELEVYRNFRCLRPSASAPGEAVRIYECLPQEQNGPLIHGWSWNATTHEMKNDGYCLDAQAYGTANGTAVQMWACTGASNQKWTWGAGGSLRSYDGTGRCLDVAGYATAEGSPLQLYDCTGGVNQAFMHADSN